MSLRPTFLQTHSRRMFLHVIANQCLAPLTRPKFPRTLRAKRSCNRRCVSVFSMSLRTSAHTGVAIRIPWQKRGTLHPCPGAHIPTKPVIANQCAHLWQSVSPQGNLASWQYLGRIRDTLRIRPKYCFLFCTAARSYGLPRRFAPRNDMQKFAACPHNSRALPAYCRKTALHPQKRLFLLHSSAPNVLATATTLPPFACHCEPVRTLVRQSVSPQGNLAGWYYFGQIRMHFSVFAQSIASCFALPQGERIATSLRSSQ